MKKAFLTIFLAVLAAFITAQTTKPGSAHGAQSNFDRIMSNEKLHCGYIPYPPEMVVDPVTGELSGYLYDIINKIGEEAGIEIVWAEEIGIANAFEGLYTGRYDAVCSGFFENPARARRVIFTEPVNYTASFVYKRANDDRFTNGFDSINNPDVTIAVVDGEISEFIAREKFPAAKIFALPQTANDPTQAMVAVQNGKADIALSQKATANSFKKENPNVIEMVGEKPVQTYSQTLANFHPNDYALKAFFDTSIRALYADGTIEKIFAKYDPGHETYLLLDKPYR